MALKLYPVIFAQRVLPLKNLAAQLDRFYSNSITLKDPF